MERRNGKASQDFKPFRLGKADRRRESAIVSLKDALYRAEGAAKTAIGLGLEKHRTY